MTIATKVTYAAIAAACSFAMIADRPAQAIPPHAEEAMPPQAEQVCETIEEHQARMEGTLPKAERERLSVNVSTTEFADHYFPLLNAIPNEDGSVDEPADADAVVSYYVQGSWAVSVFPALDGKICEEGWTVGLQLHVSLSQMVVAELEQGGDTSRAASRTGDAARI